MKKQKKKMKKEYVKPEISVVRLLEGELCGMVVTSTGSTIQGHFDSEENDDWYENDNEAGREIKPNPLP